MKFQFVDEKRGEKRCPSPWGITALFLSLVCFGAALYWQFRLDVFTTLFWISAGIALFIVAIIDRESK